MGLLDKLSGALASMAGFGTSEDDEDKKKKKKKRGDQPDAVHLPTRMQQIVDAKKTREAYLND